MWGKRARRERNELAREALNRDLATSIETVRYLVGLLVQTWAILVAANALIVGYGLAEQLAGAFFVGAGIAAVTALATWLIFTSFTALSFVAYRAERELGQLRGVVQSFAYLISPRAEEEFAKLAGTSDRAAARKALLRGSWRPGMALVTLQVAAAGVELALGVALAAYAGYDFF